MQQATVIDMSEGIVFPQDLDVCRIVGETLCQHYPGHNWLVEAQTRTGMIDIRNTSLDGMMGCRIPMVGFATASELAVLAMRYGGELLERYRVARGAADEIQLELLPTDNVGRHIYDKD